MGDREEEERRGKMGEGWAPRPISGLVLIANSALWDTLEALRLECYSSGLAIGGREEPAFRGH